MNVLSRKSIISILLSKGKTIGVIGLGQIGRHVAFVCKVYSFLFNRISSSSANSLLFYLLPSHFSLIPTLVYSRSTKMPVFSVAKRLSFSAKIAIKTKRKKKKNCFARLSAALSSATIL